MTASESPSRPTTREQRRAAAIDRLLGALEAIVDQHRAREGDTGQLDLDAERIVAEVAHELAQARNTLRRHPPLA